MNNFTVEDFSRLVSAIYAAAVTPQHWATATREICRALDGTTGGLATANGTTWSIQNSALPAGAVESYGQYYGRLDRVLDTLEQGPVGAVRAGTELIPLVRKSEFFEDWMRPYEIGEDGLFVRLSAGPRPPSVIVSAPRRTEAFDTPERVKLMSALVPHLQQALRTRNKLAAVAQSRTDVLDALDSVRQGIIIVGSDWWVVNLNTAAERILRAEDGLQMCAARIAATGMSADHRLQRALHAALTYDGSTIRSGRSFICERPSGKRPYVVHAVPLHQPETDERPSEARALVLIIDPDQQPEPSAALLRRLYGLTMTEADVALHIARGATLTEICDELSVSITTVRKHLQHVYDKTDTHRQAELVRLLLTLRP